MPRSSKSAKKNSKKVSLLDGFISDRFNKVNLTI